MKKTTLTLLLLVLFITTKAQLSLNTTNNYKLNNDTAKEKTDNINLKPIYFRVDFFLPGFNIEKSILNYNNTLVFSNWFYKSILWDYFPYEYHYDLEYRRYYNINRRIKKGKEITYYYANYLSVFTEGKIRQGFPESNSPKYIMEFQNGIGWGGNFIFAKRFYINYRIGVAGVNENNYSLFKYISPAPNIKVRIGINL